MLFNQDSYPLSKMVSLHTHFEIGGVLFGITRRINLNFLNFAQLSRKYDMLRYV